MVLQIQKESVGKQLISYLFKRLKILPRALDANHTSSKDDHYLCRHCLRVTDPILTLKEFKEEEVWTGAQCFRLNSPNQLTTVSAVKNSWKQRGFTLKIDARSGTSKADWKNKEMFHSFFELHYYFCVQWYGGH